MSNETLHDKIADTLNDHLDWHKCTDAADAILATIKADDDAKDKRIAELEAAYMGLLAEQVITRNTIAELETLVQKLASDPDYTAAYMAGVADQIATIAELEKMIDNMTAHIRIDPDE